MKKTFLALGAAALFTLVGCMTESSFTNFNPYTAKTVKNNYDILLVSNKDSLSKVYKLTSKEDGSVYYSVSAPVKWYVDDDVDAEDLEDFALITQENAQDVVDFITLLEGVYSKKDRDGDGVFYDLRVLWSYTHFEYSEYGGATSTTTTVTESEGKKTSVSKTKNTHLAEFDREAELLRIQLKTSDNEDVILYSVWNGESVEVDLEDLQTLKAALSK